MYEKTCVNIEILCINRNFQNNHKRSKMQPFLQFSQNLQAFEAKTSINVVLTEGLLSTIGR